VEGEYGEKKLFERGKKGKGRVTMTMINIVCGMEKTKVQQRGVWKCEREGLGQRICPGQRGKRKKLEGRGKKRGGKRREYRPGKKMPTIRKNEKKAPPHQTQKVLGVKCEKQVKGRKRWAGQKEILKKKKSGRENI